MKEDFTPNELREIRRALLQVAKEDYLEALKDAPEPPPFSKNHRRWERRFLKDPFSLLTPQRPLWQRGLRTAACFVLVTSVAFGSVMAGSPTARAAVVRWFTQEHNTHIAYHFQGQSSVSYLEDWTLSVLPDGYTEMERIDLESIVCVIYRNGDPEMDIELDYEILADGLGFNIDTEWHTVSDVSVLGNAGKLFAAHQEGEKNILLWINEQEGYAFMITSRLSAENLLELANFVSHIRD